MKTITFKLKRFGWALLAAIITMIVISLIGELVEIDSDFAAGWFSCLVYSFVYDYKSE
jgi:hypothetical protein